MGQGGEGVTAGPRQGFFISKLQSSLAVWQSPFLCLWRIKGPGFLELIWLVSHCRALENSPFLTKEDSSVWKVQFVALLFQLPSEP